MKTTILTKLLSLMLILTIVPLGILGYMTYNDIKDMGQTSVNNVQSIGDVAVGDATVALKSLGQQIIKQTGEQVAKELEIYIRENPDMTVAELQEDSYFKALAVQPVGKTGYTAVHESETLINRFHASEKTVNMDLHNLKEKLPEFYAIIEKNVGGNPAEGYYNWAEEDGSIKEKYMYIAVTNVKTADGYTLGVAATTYIDEFSEPVIETQAKINTGVSQMITSIDTVTKAVQNKTKFFVFIMLVLVIIAAFLFAKSITTPLKELTIAGNKIADGKLETELPKIKSNDEIKEIGDAMTLLVGAVRFLKGEKEKKK
ncbi:HAMP domain-containing protein [Candidatus Woesearchaeota archaeon]|nr:HAMP domain-containing protein [Candidatus Woesearchaeota archaeon]